MTMKIKTTSKRARKTVAVAAPVSAPTTTPIVFNSLADMLAAFKTFVGTPVPAAPTVTAPSVAEPAITPRVHKTYGLAKNPRPPFGTVTMQVFDHLKAHGFKTQAQLEQETGLTEGQIKGSIRQLTLAGYITNGTDK